MSRNSRGPARGLAALSLAVMWCAFGALTASAQGPAKPGPGSIPRVHGAPGRVSLPAGTTACPSSAAKPSSPTAACANTHPGVTPQWPYPIVTLSADPSNGAVTANSLVTFTATANFEVGAAGYYIIIWDESTGAQMAECGGGSVCSTQVGHPESTFRYFDATISLFSLQWPGNSTVAFSNDIVGSWISAAVVSDFKDPPVDLSVSALSSLDVGPTPYWIELFKFDNGALDLVGGPCGYGVQCGHFPYDGDLFVAVVANYSTTWAGLSDIRAIALGSGCYRC